MTRPILLIAALLAAGVPAITAADAHSERRLAVGTAAGFEVRPGYMAVPVYTRPVGAAWTPADTSMGFPFREPIYATPKGYKYWYVRGYTVRRVAYDHTPVVKRVYVKKATKSVRRHYRGPCVTDIGYGRYEYCP